MAYGSNNGQRITGPTAGRIEAPFPEQHKVLTPPQPVTMRGRIVKGILHKDDAALNLSTYGLWQIRTVIVDNPTSQYVWIAEAQRFVRPWTWSQVLPLEGVGQLACSFAAPLSISQASFTGAQPDSVYITALENRWPPSPGESYQVV